ncbi:MAG: MATE family efflux transporter [Treponema sp.]|nr:MATE family efflux transporter [Candidatus Treponema caballi]
MDEKKTDLFENYSIPKAVATLAVPSVLGTLVMVLYNMADTYFVGMLNDAVETAAVSLAAPMLLAFNAINNLFGVGGSSMMSRSLGKKEYDTVKKTSAFCFYLATLCGVLISITYAFFKQPFLNLLGADDITRDATHRYLFWTVTCGAAPAILNVVLSNIVRAEGEAMHASVGVMSGCILNMMLDPFFILPQFLNMGAAGAGLATLISNCFATLYLLMYIFLHRKTTTISLSPRLFGFRSDIIREVFGVGIPASIQNLLNVTGTLILNNLTAVFGAAAVSAMGIAHKINMMPIYISMGVTQGVMPLISYNWASGNRKRMKDSTMFVLRLTIIVTFSLGAAFFIFSEQLIRLFMTDPDIVTHGKLLLRAMSLGIPFLAIDFSAVAVYQAIGKGSYSLLFAVLRKIVLEIPAILILNRFYPLYGMGYAQAVAELILTVAAAFMLRKIFRTKSEIKA